MLFSRQERDSTQKVTVCFVLTAKRVLLIEIVAFLSKCPYFVFQVFT